MKLWLIDVSSDTSRFIVAGREIIFWDHPHPETRPSPFSRWSGLKPTLGAKCKHVAEVLGSADKDQLSLRGETALAETPAKTERCRTRSVVPLL